jgi:hypothetical protein
MTKEQLRMQMLAGIITEGQYKAKLNENDGVDLFREKMDELINKVNSDDSISDEEKEKRIKNIKFVVYDVLDPNTNGGEFPPSDFQFDENWWESVSKDTGDATIHYGLKDLYRAADGSSFESSEENIYL